MMGHSSRSGSAASLGVLGLATLLLAPQLGTAAAQGGGSLSGAGHEIRIVATVPPTCQLGQLGGAARAVLSGRTDSGEAVNIEFTPSTGFNIECNTAYALSLQRIGMPSPTVPRPSASAAGAQLAGALERAPAGGNGAAAGAPDGFDVLVQITDRKLAPGSVVALEQRCMFGVRQALDEHCAIQADGQPLLPRRRNVARLMLMPRLTGDVTTSDVEVVDEMALMMGADGAAATSATDPIATGSVTPRPRALKPPVIREHLMLSVTGRF